MEEEVSICNTKVFYDTEFEATIAAAKHDTLMEPYKCGTCSGYHLTHRFPAQRRGYGSRAKRCPNCKQLFRKDDSSARRHHYRGRCLNSRT